VSVAVEQAANRAGLVGSGVIHLALLVGLVLIARRAPEPPPLVYEVNLVAAPAVSAASQRAAEAAIPVQRDPEVAPPERPEPRQETAPTPPPPPVESRSQERAVPTRSDVTPLPGETPSTGTDEVTFRQEGIRFPYPEYLERIVTEIKRRWTNPVGSGLRLRSQVAFTIQRDGSVTDISFARRSSNFTFDTEALGAIERAARDRAFGPLPSGFSGGALPIAFCFAPEGTSC
jgi:outer membrane biosynthesis protein TonB